jgi:hypothetical protein
MHRYTAFVDAKGKKMSEKVERARMRSDPGAAPSGWKAAAGNLVEVNENDCWWEARVLSAKGSDLELKFRVSDEVLKKKAGKKVRPCAWLKLAAARK